MDSYKVSGCVCKKPSGNGYYLSIWWFEGNKRFRLNHTPHPIPLKKSEANHQLKLLIQQKEQELHRINGRHDLYIIFSNTNQLSRLFNVKGNTLYKYECCLKKYTKYLQDLSYSLYLEDIKPSDFQMMFQYFATYQNNKLSTIKSDKAFLHKYFNKLLVVYDLSRSNPVSLVDLSSIQFNESNVQDKRLYFTDDEILYFYKFLTNHPLYLPIAPIFRLCITLGIRRSEAIGLLWSNIDFNSNIIYIKHTRVKGYKGEIIDDDLVKARGSLRSFPITDDLHSLLSSIPHNNTNQTNQTDHIFLDSNNKPWNPDKVSKLFKRAIKEAGLDDSMTFKVTRSTCACRLLENNASDSQIISYLGHLDIETTRRHYMEASNKLKKALMDKTQLNWH